MTDLSHYRFTSTHEWVKRDGDDATIGITDHAQVQLGDVIFVDLPSIGTTLAAGQRFGTIESVKAASELYSPVAGTVSDVNTRLTETPELVNISPYDDGWIIRLTGADDSGAQLLDDAGYRAVAGE